MRVPDLIRPCTAADAEWLFWAAVNAYGADAFDHDIMRAVIPGLIEAGDTLCFLRSENSFVLADPCSNWWKPAEKEVHVTFIASLAPKHRRGWEVYRLMKSVIGWAHSRGWGVYFGSATGVDLAPVAKRLGAIREAPSFKVGFRGGQKST